VATVAAAAATDYSKVALDLAGFHGGGAAAAAGAA